MILHDMKRLSKREQGKTRLSTGQVCPVYAEYCRPRQRGRGSLLRARARAATDDSISLDIAHLLSLRAVFCPSARPSAGSQPTRFSYLQLSGWPSHPGQHHERRRQILVAFGICTAETRHPGQTSPPGRRWPRTQQKCKNGRTCKQGIQEAKIQESIAWHEYNHPLLTTSLILMWLASAIVMPKVPGHYQGILRVLFPSSWWVLAWPTETSRPPRTR